MGNKGGWDFQENSLIDTLLLYQAEKWESVFIDYKSTKKSNPVYFLMLEAIRHEVWICDPIT